MPTIASGIPLPRIAEVLVNLGARPNSLDCIPQIAKLLCRQCAAWIAHARGRIRNPPGQGSGWLPELAETGGRPR
jgi:hypothetical protein